MHIRLVNFRCYVDETFDLGDSTMALISGPSGVGKSSLFLGIYFALYGVGKKVTAHGKKSCRVELTMEGMKIIRTRAPNRLVLELDDESYEDDVAQELINRKFGDTFEVTGYIAQNAVDSFIIMSPVEKLKFLEKFAFRDINLGEIKARSKAYISETRTDLTTATSQLEMARQVLSEMTPPKQVKFPIKCKLEQQDLAAKNEGIKLKNATTLIKKFRGVRSKLDDEMQETRVLNASIEIRKESEKTLTKQIKEINSKLSKLEYDPVTLKNLEKKLDHVHLTREISRLETSIRTDSARLAEMHQDSLDQITTKISDIDEVLYKSYTKEELSVTKADLDFALVDMVSLERITRELSETPDITQEKMGELRAKLAANSDLLREKQGLLDQLELQDKIRVCPSCSAKVKIDGDNLVLCTTKVQDVKIDRDCLTREIVTLTTEVNSLTKMISKYEVSMEKFNKLKRDRDLLTEKYHEISPSENIREQLQEITEYEWEQNRLEKTRKFLEQELQNPKPSQSEKKLRLELDQNIRKLEGLRVKVTFAEEITVSEQELQNLISDQKLARSDHDSFTRSLFEYNENLKNIQKTISVLKEKHVDTYGVIRPEKEILEDIENTTEKISEQEQKKSTSEENMKLIEEFQRYKKERENYRNWKTKVSDLEKQEQIARNKYASATEIRETILQSESIAVGKIIDNINTHAALFLDSFFPDHPIMVQLQPFKQTKKNTTSKPQINIEIEYKGMECDISSLSGGELSRVILAYTLALAEIFNTPILLLDECTSSLDQELTGVVFDSIRSNFPDKSVFIIAHQVITGTFDKVISLSKN